MPSVPPTPLPSTGIQWTPKSQPQYHNCRPARSTQIQIYRCGDTDLESFAASSASQPTDWVPDSLSPPAFVNTISDLRDWSGIGVWILKTCYLSTSLALVLSLDVATLVLVQAFCFCFWWQFLIAICVVLLVGLGLAIIDFKRFCYSSSVQDVLVSLAGVWKNVH